MAWNLQYLFHCYTMYLSLIHLKKLFNTNLSVRFMVDWSWYVPRYGPYLGRKIGVPGHFERILEAWRNVCCSRRPSESYRHPRHNAAEGGARCSVSRTLCCSPCCRLSPPHPLHSPICRATNTFAVASTSGATASLLLPPRPRVAPAAGS